MREKVGKSRFTVFFQCFVAPEGQKVGSLKRRVRSQLARGEMKNCTLLWREAHFQVKMYRTHHVRTTFGSWDVEKCARPCGTKHISKSKCTKHTTFGPLLEVVMLKKCTPLWREAHFQVKMHKTPQPRTTFGSWDVAKVHAAVARSTFPKSKCTKHTMYGPFLEVQMSFSCGRRKGLCTLSKVTKTWGFCSISKNDGRHGTFEEDLQRCIFPWQAQYNQGADFPERGCILEYQMCRFAKMILRDRCSTSYDLASIFRGTHSILDRWTGKNRKTHWHESVSSALNFPFLKEVSENSSFLMSCTSKNEEVSQNCFVSDVVKFKKWRSLAELFRFRRCYVQTLWKSRRISSFLILQIDR